MRVLTICGQVLAAAATIIAAPAAAEVNYTFTGTYNSAPIGFSYTTADYINTYIAVSSSVLDSCLAPAATSCADVDFDPHFYNITYDSISPFYTSGGGFSSPVLIFSLGALGADGTYMANVGYPQFAGQGTLVVSSSSVPEPATWTMMLLGFGAVGASMRWRTRPRSAAA